MAQPLVTPAANPTALAKAIETGFQAAVAKAVDDAHDAGLAVPVLGAGDKVVWLPPDTTVLSAKKRA